jgi:MYXO-CTERM domain-containing protein
MGQNTITTAIAATLLASSAASAAISANTATINLSANGAAQTVSNNATDLGDGRFAHSGFWASNGMLVQWSNLITAYTVVNGVETAYVSGGFTIKNNNATTPLVLDLSVLMAGSMGAGATYAGSAGGQGVNFSFNPGSLGATAGAPVWAGLVNGAQVGGVITSTQTVNPFSLASFAPQSFNGSAGSVSGGVGMRLRLSISAGMESSFSGAFSVTSVPAPGAVALAGAAGLLGGRRRR